MRGFVKGSREYGGGLCPAANISQDLPIVPCPGWWLGYRRVLLTCFEGPSPYSGHPLPPPGGRLSLIDPPGQPYHHHMMKDRLVEHSPFSWLPEYGDGPLASPEQYPAAWFSPLRPWRSTSQCRHGTQLSSVSYRTLSDAWGTGKSHLRHLAWKHSPRPTGYWWRASLSQMQGLLCLTPSSSARPRAPSRRRRESAQ